MTKKILCLRDLGHETFWKILHDAGELPTNTHTSDILHGAKVLLLTVGALHDEAFLFAQAITDLGGSVLPLHMETAPETAGELIHSTTKLAQGAALCVCCGLPQHLLEPFANEVSIPVLNGVSGNSSVVAVIGDLCLMRQSMPDMDTMRIGWVGGATPLAHSLIEASMYVPYELFMALPEWGEPDRNLLGLAFSTGSKIFLTREVHLAVDEAHFVYAGAGFIPAASFVGTGLQELTAGMKLDASTMALAAPTAHILLGGPWSPACPAPLSLVEGPSSLCPHQKNYSLRVAKSLLPWLINIS